VGLINAIGAGVLVGRRRWLKEFLRARLYSKCKKEEAYSPELRNGYSRLMHTNIKRSKNRGVMGSLATVCCWDY
jgi:hypothetical protein